MRKKEDEFVVSIAENAFTESELKLCIQKKKVPNNAISWAAHYGHTDFVRDLIKLGADINENRNYPLELACKYSHTEIVKLLLDAGARTFHSVDDEGYCLRMASSHGRSDIVKLLLDAGANPLADNYYALKLALDCCSMDTVELLLSAIYATKKELTRAKKIQVRFKNFITEHQIEGIVLNYPGILENYKNIIGCFRVAKNEWIVYEKYGSVEPNFIKHFKTQKEAYLFIADQFSLKEEAEICLKKS